MAVQGDFANSFRVNEEYGWTGAQGCSNPGLELANAFSVLPYKLDFARESL